MIDIDELNEDRAFLNSLNIDFDGLEDGRVLRILEALQVANRNTDRWKAIAHNLFNDVNRLRTEKKQVIISVRDGVTISCDAAAVGEVMAQLSPR